MELPRNPIFCIPACTISMSVRAYMHMEAADMRCSQLRGRVLHLVDALLVGEKCRWRDDVKISRCLCALSSPLLSCVLLTIPGLELIFSVGS